MPPSRDEVLSAVTFDSIFLLVAGLCPSPAGHANGRREKWVRRRKAYRHIIADYDVNGRAIGSAVSSYLEKVRSNIRPPNPPLPDQNISVQVGSREYNEREWVRSMRARYQPTERSQLDPKLRSFARDAPQLQRNGGVKAPEGKFERLGVRLGTSTKGISAALAAVIETSKSIVGKK